MAAVAIAPNCDRSTEVDRLIAPQEKRWSCSGLLKEIRRYLYRYGTATDIDTDPIELLRQAHVALDSQEQAFEKEHDEDWRRLEALEKENAQLKADLAAAKAKTPPWWRG